jgi:hypothetical protein
MVSGVKKIRTKGGGKVINIKSKRRHRKAIIFKSIYTILFVKYKF